jgi:hypothetical protein
MFRCFSEKQPIDCEQTVPQCEFSSRTESGEATPDDVRLKKELRLTRETLHELIERIPEAEIAAAQRFLEFLATSAAFRATLSAPPDDEPITRGDTESIARAHRDIQAGKVVSHEEILREFGVR